MLNKDGEGFSDPEFSSLVDNALIDSAVRAADILRELRVVQGDEAMADRLGLRVAAALTFLNEPRHPARNGLTLRKLEPLVEELREDDLRGKGRNWGIYMKSAIRQLNGSGKARYHVNAEF